MLRRLAGMLRDRWQSARDPVAFARRIGVTVGRDAILIAVSRKTFGSEPYLIALGDRVAVAADVRFVTHDGGTLVLRHKHPSIDRVGRIVVHDNVVLGLGAILLPGVEIGPNAVVGAGSVVTRSVPPDTVVAGVPARILMTMAEYEAATLPRALHVAHLSPAEKRRIFLDYTAEPGRMCPPMAPPRREP
jgi:transferase family hexapeptide repeat protein